MSGVKDQWLENALGFKRKGAPDGLDVEPGSNRKRIELTDDDGPTLVVRPEPVRELKAPVDSWRKYQEEMERRAREYIEEYYRVHGVHPLFDKLMRLPWFRRAVAEADERERRKAAEEIMARMARDRELMRRIEEENQRRLKPKREALLQLKKTLEKVEGLLDKYLGNENGYLLLLKQVVSIGAALAALSRMAPNNENFPGVPELNEIILDLRRRLEILEAAAQSVKPEKMKEYIESRYRELGYDVGNKKMVPQEGQVGSDIEMEFGGLTRSQTPNVEFIGGELGPYAGVTFDVFGLTPETFRKQIPLFVWQLVSNLLKARKIKQADIKKIGDYLNTIPDDVLQFFEDRLANNDAADATSLLDITTAALVTGGPLNISWADLWKQFWSQFNFLGQLKAHLKKARIVPFDVSGFTAFPGLVEAIKRYLRQNLGDDYYRLYFYDVPPR